MIQSHSERINARAVSNMTQNIHSAYLDATLFAAVINSNVVNCMFNYRDRLFARFFVMYITYSRTTPIG